MPKKFLKILFVVFLTYFSLQLASFLFLAPQPARAVNDSMPKLQVPIPDVSLPGEFLKFSEMTCTGEGKNKTCSIPWIAEYIAAVYKYAIGIVGILATVVMMVGGIIWLTAGGNATRVGEAKSWITASLTGLVIALSSYMILYQINPDLIKFKPIKVTVVKKEEAPPAAAGTLNSQDARNKLDKFIQVQNIATLQGIREQTINELNSLLGECNSGLNFGCGSIMVTSGTTGSHEEGEFSHANGWKADIALSPESIKKYITNSEKNKGTYTYRGTRSDGAQMYQNSRGACYAMESDHWDISTQNCPSSKTAY